MNRKLELDRDSRDTKENRENRNTYIKKIQEELLDHLTYERPKSLWRDVSFKLDFNEMNSGSWRVIVSATCDGREEHCDNVHFSVPVNPPQLTTIDSPRGPSPIAALYAALMGVLWLEEHEVFEHLMLDGSLLYEAHKLSLGSSEAWSLYMLSSQLMERTYYGGAPVLSEQTQKHLMNLFSN